MSEAILVFDLTLENDKAWFQQCLKAKNMAMTLEDLRDRLRQTHKYDAPAMTYEEFFVILGDNNLNLEEINI